MLPSIKTVAVEGLNGVREMMHCPDCGWTWAWDDDPTPHCSFCGSVGQADDDAPPEAHAAVNQASGSAFDGGHAAIL